MIRHVVLGLVLVLIGCATQRQAPEIAQPRPETPHHHIAPRRKPLARHKIAAIPLPRPRPAITRVVPIPPPAPKPAIAAAPVAHPAPVLAAKPKAPGPWVPVNARRYAPVLVIKQREFWSGAPQPYTLGGLVEQESCVSLKSRRCWDPRAQLKTSRELGIGLGQITIAYNRDGSVRFNKFAELKREYASLHAWRWEDRFDPGYQLVATIEMMYSLWRHVPPAHDAVAHWAFSLSSYNGGRGSLLQDRRLCANSPGCDPTRWFGNIETHSLKSRKPQPAYGGQSWFGINRSYVKNVLLIRRAKYRQFWE